MRRRPESHGGAGYPPRVAEIRAHYGLSQSRFAALLGISVRILQNWE